MTSAAPPPAAAVPQSSAAPGTGPATLTGDEPVPPSVTPFWQRMPRMFLFPMQRPPLVRNIAATILFSLVVWVGLPEMQQSPMRWMLLIGLCWIGTSLFIARFGFLVIERTAAGYLDSRSYPSQESEPDWLRPLKMFLVLVFVPIFIALVGALILPGPLVVLALLGFTLLLPASVMVLTMTDSFGEAVNPARCLQTATRIGPPYLLLCLFLFMLSISSRQAVAFLLGGAAPAHTAGPQGAEATLAAVRGTLGISVFVFTLVGNYFLILTCNLIGYAMYQHSDVLGIDVIGPGEAQRGGPVSAAAHERRVREAMIGKMIAAGEFRDAMDLISDEMRTRPNDLSLHVRMHKLLIHEGSAPRIESHSDRFLELLMAKSNVKEALALYEETRARFPNFVPHDVGRLPQLAGAAIDALKPDLAAQIIRGFDKKYPGHPKVPDVYVIGARIMLQSEHAREARRLLEYVIKSYPDAPAAAEARRYLARFTAPPSNPGPATLSGRATGGGPATVPAPVAATATATETAQGTPPVPTPAVVTAPATVPRAAATPAPSPAVALGSDPAPSRAPETASSAAPSSEPARRSPLPEPMPEPATQSRAASQAPAAPTGEPASDLDQPLTYTQEPLAMPDAPPAAAREAFPDGNEPLAFTQEPLTNADASQAVSRETVPDPEGSLEFTWPPFADPEAPESPITDSPPHAEKSAELSREPSPTVTVPTAPATEHAAELPAPGKPVEDGPAVHGA